MVKLIHLETYRGNVMCPAFFSLLSASILVLTRIVVKLLSGLTVIIMWSHTKLDWTVILY